MGFILTEKTKEYYKKTKHWDTCDAPICQDSMESDFKENVIWYPGEEVCYKKPYKLFQKVQVKIIALIKDCSEEEIEKMGCFTASMLEKIERVKRGI